MHFGKRIYINITSSVEGLSKTLCKCTITQPNKIISTLFGYISSQAVTRILQNYKVQLYPGFVKVCEVGLEFGTQFNQRSVMIRIRLRVSLNPTPSLVLTLATLKTDIQSAISKTTSHITLDLLKGCWVTYWKNLHVICFS